MRLGGTWGQPRRTTPRILVGMAGDDAKLERITDLILALLDAPRPIPLSQLSEEIPGYPEGHEARRQAFERVGKALRGFAVAAFKPAANLFHVSGMVL